MAWRTLVRSALAAGGLEIRRHRRHPYRPLGLPAEPRTILDVGAADGTPELYEAYPDALVVAFDPLTEQLEKLRRRQHRRPVEIVNVAIGQLTADVEIDVVRRNLLKSSFHRRTPLTRPSDGIVARTVPMRRLDDLVRERRWSAPFVLKIDTEGHELDVLRGADYTLAQTAVVYCETTIGARFERGYRFSHVAGILIERGFELSDVLDAPVLADGRTSYIDCVWVAPTKRL